ncbi:MAG: capsular biosynthesis protein [Campylobacterales bacterium]|nr:capsular biosynthesis protein [Campylobacterales bacterium]
MYARLKRLFRPKKQSSEPLTTDLHSHLVPGIDDGAKDLEASLNLVRSLYDLGYRRLITTPHIMMHRFPNSRDTILRGLDTLRSAVDAEGIPVTIDAASEYYVDEHFRELIGKGELLTFGENEVLFELSYIIPPVDLDTIIFELQSCGYQPVLAHPERFLYMHKDEEAYPRLREKGVRFQVNINSLGGYYSKPVEKAARRLMDEGWITYLGSDTHHRRHIDALTKTLHADVVAKVQRNNTLRNNAL